MNFPSLPTSIAFAGLLVACTVLSARAADDDAEASDLAKKLQNPVADLISVPIQSNWDFGMGPTGEGWQYKANIQPVIPISLDADWNVISRTILPVISQDRVVGTGSQSGLSDTLQSLFFSPKKPTSGGWIWGVGPAILLPTATSHFIGTEKWAAGPTAVVLKQENGWTYGMLANHLWSFAGVNSREDVDSTFLQPFVAYTTHKQTTYALNSESTYDWQNRQWTAPVNLSVSQLVKIGGLPVQFQLGGRYYFDRPANGPDWGLRFTVTFLFPK